MTKADGLELTISSYRPEYKSDFVSLNLEWLERFFYVEDHDKEVLNQCETYILKPGGEIFFFLLDNMVVGTYAFMKIEDHVYEFTKMAVSPKHRGKGIGQKMMEQALSFAKESDFETIFIYTSSILPNAIHIYEKYGFEHIEMEKDKPYERGDVKMKLDL